jgi:hypothetical protein
MLPQHDDRRRTRHGMTPIPAANDDSAGTDKAGYQVVAGSREDDRSTLIGLWANGLAEGRTAQARLEWRYLRHPEGMPRCFLLCRKGSMQPVGAAAIERRRMRFGSESVCAGNVIDFVVEPKHRSLFPAVSLQREVLQRARGEYAVIFGTPAERARAVVRRAGYLCVGPMVRMVRPLRWSALLSRFVPGWLGRILGPVIDHALLATASMHGLFNRGYRWEWRARPDADFDGLWQRIEMPRTLVGVRDRAFLEWRFAGSPFHAHRFFALLSKDDGRLVAYAACHAEGDALHVDDFLADPAVPGAGRRLWLDLSREAYREGHRSLSVEFLGAGRFRREMDALGMVRRDEWPLYAAFEGRPELSSPSGWYITGADRDV